MKKQIFILTMLTLAFLFAGVKSYGQNPDKDYIDGASIDCVPAIPLNCASDDTPISPIPGKEYIYSVNDEGTVTKVKAVHWFAYNATATPPGFGPDIITNNVLTINREELGNSLFILDAHKVGAPADKTVYNNELNEDLSIEISWQSFDGLANQILLVAYVEGDECADNIEVYRIIPAFSFTLDVASLMPDGKLNGATYTDGIPSNWTDAEICVAPVWQATYVPEVGSDPGEMDVDYGENYVYFVVNAANFVHSWRPTFEAAHVAANGDIITAGSEIIGIAWATQDNAISSTGTWNTPDNDGLYPVVNAVNAAAGSLGECIVVRVEVKHNDVDNVDVTGIQLTVNGFMRNADTGDYTTLALRDLDEPVTAGSTACEHVPDADVATHKLIPRPKIESTTANPGGTPNPLPFVPPVTPQP